jgi:hypothetical protein
MSSWVFETILFAVAAPKEPRQVVTVNAADVFGMTCRQCKRAY